MVDLLCTNDISIHVPTRGTTPVEIRTESPHEFQSTCPRGARQIDDNEFGAWKISIHVPTRGTTKFHQVLHSILLISIHVPTRGTTPEPATSGGGDSISIHVPTRGTTPLGRMWLSWLEFQSTCPRGARLPYVWGDSCIPWISIHVPTRGTTYASTPTWGESISIHVPTRGTT